MTAIILLPADVRQPQSNCRCQQRCGSRQYMTAASRGAAANNVAVVPNGPGPYLVGLVTTSGLTVSQG